MVTQRSGPSRPGVTRTYSPPPCPGLPPRAGRAAGGRGLPRAALPRGPAVGRRRLHRRRPVLRALRLPGVTIVILSEIDGHRAASRLGRFYAPAGPPPAARRGRRGRRDRAGLLLLSLDRGAGCRWSATPQASLLYVANWHFLAPVQRLLRGRRRHEPVPALLVAVDRGAVLPRLPAAAGGCSSELAGGAGAGVAVIGLVAALAGAVGGRPALLGAGRPQPRLLRHRHPAYQLLAGALLALLLRSRRHRARPAARPAVVRRRRLVGLVVVASGLARPGRRRSRGLLATVSPSALRHRRADRRRAAGRRGCCRAGPVYLGQISYGTYLWHWPVIVVLRRALDSTPWSIAALTVPIATGLAALSYEVLEMPIRKRAGCCDRLRWQRPSSGVGVSALVAATLVPVGRCSPTRPRARGSARRRRAAAWRHAAPVTVPGRHRLGARSTTTSASTGTCKADDRRPCTVVHGDGPHVLLVGDSQAQMLVPMFEQMAKEHDLTAVAQRHAPAAVAGGPRSTPSSRPRARSAATRPASAGTTTCCRSCTRTWSCPGQPARATTAASGATWSARRDGKQQSLRPDDLRAPASDTLDKISRTRPQDAGGADASSCRTPSSPTSA